MEFSKTFSVDAVVVVEYEGPVIADVLHPTMLRVLAQVTITGGVSVATVKVDVHVIVCGGQVLVYVNVTVLDPPHLDGAPVLLFVIVPLHPPPAFTDLSHFEYLALIDFCV